MNFAALKISDFSTAFKDSEEPLNATKVSQISGVEKKEVDKIMKELKKDETIYSPKRCYWALKE